MKSIISSRNAKKGVFTVFHKNNPVYLSFRHSKLSMKGYWYLLLLCFGISCQPKVLSFTAQPSRIATGDSVHLKWKTRGEASMSFRQTKVLAPPDSVAALDFILTATRGSKVSAPMVRQVVLDQQRDLLALDLRGIEGDSLLYTADKDTAFRSDRVGSLSIVKADPVAVLHEGHVCVLTAPGPDPCMQGLPYSGSWSVKIKMTAAQAANRHLIPGTYSLLVTILPK
jgi:hypothetical protein